MRLLVSDRVKEKLIVKHKVRIEEVEQCFLNRWASFLEDTRIENRTEPPTEWFISETDVGRRLKVCFIPMSDGAIKVKTAFKPSKEEEDLYERRAKKI